MPSTAQRVVAERYALGESLGRGAMGAVWAADDRVLRRRVAVKEIDPPPSLSPEERAAMGARVMREARAAARLSHPGAVTVFDVVESDERPWIVMEYVDAPTLEEVVRDAGPLSPERTATIGLELLDVLETAHREGIVHRDVKPGNVMCPSGGRTKLTDFGIASLQDDPKITATGLVLGSPAYMSPEQAQSATSGPASDLWSLGATLYFAVEGRAPFDKGQAISTLTAVVGEPAPPPQRAGALAGVLMRLLEKDPAARPAPAELRRDLAVIAGGATSATAAATVAQASESPPTRAETGAVSPRDQPAVPARRPQRSVSPAPDRTWDRWGIALIALVLMAVAAVLIPRLIDGDAPPDRAGERKEDAAANGDGAQRSGDASSGSEKAAEESDSDAAAPPDDWVGYTGPNGYTLFHPPGWEERPAGETAVDLVDPAARSYIRVEYTDAPGDDVLGTLQDQAEGFGNDHVAYTNLGVEAVGYRGYDAALWEYTYEEGGATLHAYNLQFVTGTYGYALNFQTREDDWDASSETWETIKATFVPVE